MAVVRLRAPLTELAGGKRELELDGATVARSCARSSTSIPRSQGWILDERSTIRRAHQRLRERGTGGRTRLSPPTTASTYSPRSEEVESKMTELLVGTKKGLFALEGDNGRPFEITARAFAGEPVEFAMRDPRTGRYFACVTSAFYGPKLFVTDDPAGEWQQAEGIELPEGDEKALIRLWTVVPGRRTAICTRAAIPACSSRAVTAARPGSSTRRSGSSRRAPTGARRRRHVPALDRDLARRPVAARAGDLGRRRLALGRRRRRPGGTATRASYPAICPRTRGRTPSPSASTTCIAPRRSRNGSSCSSTAASTARTTQARAGVDIGTDTASPPTSASRSSSTRTTRTART